MFTFRVVRERVLGIVKIFIEIPQLTISLFLIKILLCSDLLKVSVLQFDEKFLLEDPQYTIAYHTEI